MRDEHYILNLCDEILGCDASRQHRFDFLRGDAGKRNIGSKLPVDGYYEKYKLVIEYHERQHTQTIEFFDRRDTISGVSRGEQRKIYDQRRRDILGSPEIGICLIELHCNEFKLKGKRKLQRDEKSDEAVIRERLSKFL